MATDEPAIRVHFSRQGTRHWRIHAEGFVQDGQHVIQLLNASYGDLILVLETRADFLGQLMQNLWMFS